MAVVDYGVIHITVTIPVQESMRVDTLLVVTGIVYHGVMNTTVRVGISDKL